MSGKLMMNKKLSGMNTPGENVFRFEKENLPPGVYLYRTTVRSETAGEGRMVIE